MRCAGNYCFLQVTQQYRDQSADQTGALTDILLHSIVSNWVTTVGPHRGFEQTKYACNTRVYMTTSVAQWVSAPQRCKRCRFNSDGTNQPDLEIFVVYFRHVFIFIFLYDAGFCFLCFWFVLLYESKQYNSYTENTYVIKYFVFDQSQRSVILLSHIRSKSP